MNKEKALLDASLNGDITLVQNLLDEGIDPNCNAENGRGPLLTFYPEILNALLTFGAIPNEQYNENGHSAFAGLCYANSIFLQKGTNQLECIRLLIDHGADIEKGYELSNETPLHHATAPMGEENLDIIKLLLENQANPNAKTTHNINSHNFYHGAKTKGETPLHRAAAFCQTATVNLLIEHGASKEIVDANDDSPLAWACWYRRPKELIDILR